MGILGFKLLAIKKTERGSGHCRGSSKLPIQVYGNKIWSKARSL